MQMKMVDWSRHRFDIPLNMLFDTYYRARVFGFFFSPRYIYTSLFLLQLLLDSNYTGGVIG